MLAAVKVSTLAIIISRGKLLLKILKRTENDFAATPRVPQ